MFRWRNLRLGSQKFGTLRAINNLFKQLFEPIFVVYLFVQLAIEHFHLCLDAIIACLLSQELLL